MNQTVNNAIITTTEKPATSLTSLPPKEKQQTCLIMFTLQYRTTLDVRLDQATTCSRDEACAGSWPRAYHDVICWKCAVHCWKRCQKRCQNDVHDANYQSVDERRRLL